jgi:hypothetical protein
MRLKMVAAVAAAVMALTTAAHAEDAKFNTTTTLLGAILDDAAGKAAFAKVFPDLIVNPQLEQGRGMTLTQIQGFAPQIITDEKLKELQAEFDKIPAPAPPAPS